MPRVRHRAATPSAGTSRSCRPRPSARSPRRSGAGASEGARVVLASDQSARLAEILAEDDIAVAPVERPPRGRADRRRRPRRAQPERRVRGRPGRPRLRHRPRALRLGPRAAAASHAPGRAPRPARAPRARRHRRPRRPRRGALRGPRAAARRRGAAARSATTSSCSSPRPGRIWVPVEQIERVTRYAGGEQPQLSRLGGGEWQRARTRVRKAVGDLARDLLALYADASPGARVGRSARTRPGRPRWRPPSPTRRRPTSCAPPSR